MSPIPTAAAGVTPKEVMPSVPEAAKMAEIANKFMSRAGEVLR
jgi:hypothetical protein